MPSPDSDNRPNPTGHPALLLWRSLQDTLASRFSAERSGPRDHGILLTVTVILLALLIIPDQHSISTRYRVGEIAATDIRASRDHLVEDRKLTAEKQAEAAAAVQIVYELDTNHANALVQRLVKGVALLRDSGGDPTSREIVSQQLGVELAPAELSALGRLRLDRSLQEALSRTLGGLYGRFVVADERSYLNDRLSGIHLVSPAGDPLADTLLQRDHLELAEAQRQLRSSRLAAGEGETGVLFRGVVSRMLRPNLVYSRDRTEARRAAARQSVSPVLIQVKRGEMLARDGDRITAEQEMKLTGMAADRPLLGRICTAFGTAGIIAVLLYFPFRFARKNIRKFRPGTKDLALLSLLMVGHFLLLKVFSSVSATLGGAFPAIDTADYFYLFPFAAAAIMIRIIINSEVALVFSAVCAPLAGLMYGSVPVVVYSLLGSIIGAHGVRHCDSRGIIFSAGMKVSVVNLAMALSFQLVHENFFTAQTLYCLMFASASGLVSAVIASGGIPVIENLFQYTTDIKLLEMTNLNSPVLRELMVRAPGTYHHSVMVGNLVEAAAETINANPLLARVAAYYHDIGKISKPQYFIENQRGGENRHDKLTPHMSALILIAHAKEGAELARQHRLGQPIAEIIRQSHGTALIKYFYQKAQEQAGPDQVVDEREFRYPGPKPQTREAGLVLLADCVEAACRTLMEPTPARIQGLVQKIINNIFIDGQLDECELTLKNLHEIAWSFNRVLAGSHHQRIDYPQPAYKEKHPTGRRQHGDHSDTEPPKAPENGPETPKSGGGDDLKRLGMLH
jgi:putative nucleotidyltransferase with HDIG domain